MDEIAALNALHYRHGEIERALAVIAEASPERGKAAAELRAAGWSYGRLAAELSVSRNAAVKMVARGS